MMVNDGYGLCFALRDFKSFSDFSDRSDKSLWKLGRAHYFPNNGSAKSVLKSAKSVLKKVRGKRLPVPDFQPNFPHLWLRLCRVMFVL